MTGITFWSFLAPGLGPPAYWGFSKPKPTFGAPVKPTWWYMGLVLFGFMMMMPTWMILNWLTGRQDAVLALVGAQLLVTGFCYVRYRKALAANPAQMPS